jgi:hypothetical protein
MEPRSRSDQSKKPLPKAKAQERMKAAQAAAASTAEPAGEQAEG